MLIRTYHRKIKHGKLAGRWALYAEIMFSNLNELCSITLVLTGPTMIADASLIEYFVAPIFLNGAL